MSCRYVVLTLFALSLNVIHGYAQDAFSQPPIASNKINSVRLSELNLKSSDYTVLNTLTETSLVSFELQGKNKYTISCEDEDFRLEYKWNGKEKQWEINDWEGVVKLGFLSGEDDDIFFPSKAATVAKRLAIYKLINEAQMKGADGVIEPIISMNMARNGKLYYYKTTVSGKPIKITVNN